jgi:hypothetical protein
VNLDGRGEEKMQTKERTVKLPEGVLYGVKILTDELKSGKCDLMLVMALIDMIEPHIEAKIEALERREIYTSYKTSKPGSEEREMKRKEYLTKAGIHRKWQTQTEQLENK